MLLLMGGIITMEHVVMIWGSMTDDILGYIHHRSSLGRITGGIIRSQGDNKHNRGIIGRIQR